MNNDKIELTQDDYEMSKYIYKILLSQPTIIASWGYQSPVVIKLGLRFKVNGFKHQGRVEIRYNEGADLFDIYLINDDNSLKDSLVGIYVDELLRVIDENVEMVLNYNERVNQEYNIINYDQKTI
ncbi:MAG: hypothetical protein PHR83_01990 [Paludibacter sp.]|nr:hypothetical protein [Paludibacter sp.]